MIATIPGLPPKKAEVGRRFDPSDDDYDEPPPRNRAGADRGRRGRGDDSEEEPPRNNRKGGSPPGKTKHVSVEEYDELSNLCDRLMAQQEELQSEIRTQASIIKV